MCVCVRKRERERRARARNAKRTASAPDERGNVQERSKTEEHSSCYQQTCQRGRNVASDKSGSVYFEHTKQTCCTNVMNSSSARSFTQRFPCAQTQMVSPVVPYSPLGSCVCATPPVCVCVYVCVLERERARARERERAKKREKGCEVRFLPQYLNF